MKQWKQWETLFSWVPKSLQLVTAAMKLSLAPWEESYDKLRQYIKKQRHYFANKGPSSQGYHFSSSHVWMWELDGEESWVLKNWCFWTVAFQKTLESPSDYKVIQPVHPIGDQSWVFIGRTAAEAETPKLWPPNMKNWLIWKDPDSGKDWKQEKVRTEDEIVGCHYWLNRHECEQALCVVVGVGSLVCCSLWVTKSRTWLSDWDELNWPEMNFRPLDSSVHSMLQVRIVMWVAIFFLQGIFLISKLLLF